MPHRACDPREPEGCHRRPRPGGRLLLLETVLSKKSGVSRTPIREALGRLAQDGFLERSSRGFRVRVRSPEEILEIYEARIALESACTGFAATRRTDFDLAQIAFVLEQRREADDNRTFGPLNNEWHAVLRTAAHNETIVSLLDRLDSQLEIYRARGASSTPAHLALEEHTAIFEAVRDQRPLEAESLMRQHLSRTRDQRVEAFLREARRS
jgi:DNA-binding GntR family transcriptional regulator